MSLERVALLADLLRLGGGIDATPLMRLVVEVGNKIDETERQMKAREMQLLDALDEVKSLRAQVSERDDMIAELQAMNSRAREDAAQ